MKKLTLVKHEGNGPVSLNDIDVPDSYYDRIQTGIPEVDLLFGGGDTPGIQPNTVTMLTGMPGAGKSTFVLQLADTLSRKAGQCVLVNVCEETPIALKLAADRLGISSDFLVDSVSEVDELIEIAKKMEVEFVIQDSIQTLNDGELRPGTRAHLLSVNRKLIRMAKDDGITTLFTGQVVKSGSAAGPLTLVHEVDAHCHMKVDKVTGGRMIFFEKNRMGPSYIPFDLHMGPTGLLFRQGEKIVEPLGKKDTLVRAARDLLLGGEKLSGYCHERFGFDCSGGFWRGVVGQAVAQLQREGLDVVEAKIGGRTHHFIPDDRGGAEA